VSDEPATGYAFGDTPLAADRLELVARVFKASSRAFLRETVRSRPGVALDLGCGPGWSTRLVAATTGARSTIGVDRSAAFVERAAAAAPAGIDFVRHDVTSLPLPGAPADLISCRLVLAHLPNPRRLIAGWGSQLAPGGLLLVDEVERIETTHPTLDRYEELVVAVVAAHGGTSYAGPVIDTMSPPKHLRRMRSELRVVPVSTAHAARMYGMNLSTWRRDPAAARHCSVEELDAIAADLDDLAHVDRTGDISWGIRQVAFERVS
jgi:trans-aconitate 2-methyltransferase